MKKINFSLLLLLLCSFSTKSHQYNNVVLPSWIEESTIEFEVIDFTIKKDQFEVEKVGLVKTAYFNLACKAKRNNVLLPCEYGMSFYASSKKLQCRQYVINGFIGCSWSSKMDYLL